GADVPDDVRMAELFEDLVLALEPRQGLLVARQAERDDLESDDPVRFAIFLKPRPVDRTHGAATEFLLDDEGPDSLFDVHGKDPRGRPAVVAVADASKSESRRGERRQCWAVVGRDTSQTVHHQLYTTPVQRRTLDIDSSASMRACVPLRP